MVNITDSLQDGIDTNADSALADGIDSTGLQEEGLPACMPLTSVPQALLERQGALRACPLAIVVYVHQPVTSVPQTSMQQAAADAFSGSSSGSGVSSNGKGLPLPVCATASLINNAPQEPLYGWQLVWSWPHRNSVAAADVQGAVLITNGKGQGRIARMLKNAMGTHVSHGIPYKP